MPVNTDPRTVGELVRTTPVTTPTKKLTVHTVLLDAVSSSYHTTIFDDSTDQRHHGMRLGNEWIIGWGQQMGTETAALHLHDEAVTTARTLDPRPVRDSNGDLVDYEGQPM